MNQQKGTPYLRTTCVTVKEAVTVHQAFELKIASFSQSQS